MGLDAYRRKRDFAATPEPRGSRVRKRAAGRMSFLVQKHAATRLHYDFRLELDGVLLSWAVPKGPSLDPRDKRLAVHVEDHPLEYGDFEGVIPERQYGGGTVLLWDRGTWQPAGDPRASYAKGHLKFSLEGEKLRGGWNLVRTHGRYGKGDDDKSWLLIKEDDEHARSSGQTSVTDEHPESVTSGRSMEEIADDADRVWQSNRSVTENVRATKRRARRARSTVKVARLAGATKGAMPGRLEPQLATLVKQPVDGDDWIHEIKYDGYRMLARLEGGALRMVSRSGRDWTGKFPRVERALARLPLVSAWLDGEVVVLDQTGRSSFQSLQNALTSGEGGAFVYFVFDALYVDGFDLRHVPLVERKGVLQKLLAGTSDSSPLRYSGHVTGMGGEFFAQVCELQLEGAVSKRATSPYEAGRARSWLKVKCSKRQELVIGGYTEPDGAREAFGALHLGVYDRDGELRYAGKVGTGFTQASLATLFARLQPLRVSRPPFRNPPKGAEARRSQWVKPELVCEVTFTEWTDDGTLRHPAFQGLRDDRPAREVVREVEQSAAASRPEKTLQRQRPKKGDAVVCDIVITNPDKHLYPEAGLSKLDLARFYEAIGDHLLPHLQDRPLTIVRCPNGWQAHCFYQKNARGTHPALDRIKVNTSDGPADYLMANSVSAIVATLQLGALELHPWAARAGKLDFADRLTFDLDPADDVGWPTIVEAANLVRTLLEKIGLEGFLKTTGGKGLHVVLPVEPTLRWETAKGFSKAVADLLCQTFPDRFTPSISRESRRGKIFIDYLRNAEGSTAVAAYSLRARANAPVPTPIAWNELARDVRFDHFNVKTLPRRLERMRRDPWSSFFSVRQTITPGMMEQVGYTAGAASHSANRRRWKRR